MNTIFEHSFCSLLENFNWIQYSFCAAAMHGTFGQLHIIKCLQLMPPKKIKCDHDEAIIYMLISYIIYLLLQKNTSSSVPHEVFWKKVCIKIFVFSLGFPNVSYNMNIVLLVFEFFNIENMNINWRLMLLFSTVWNFVLGLLIIFF